MKYDEGREGFLYVLMEHKSYSYNGVIFQLLVYMSQIYKDHYDKKIGKVPIVIPIVIYHGDDNWNPEKEFLKYVDVDTERDKDLLKYIPNFFFRFYDIPRMEIDRKDFSNELKSFVLSLRLREHKEDIEELIMSLDKVKNEDWFLKTFAYIAELLNEKDKAKIDEIIKTEILDRGDDIMTLAQSWREEGIQIGIEKGKIEGKVEGKVEGLIYSARNMLKRNMDIETISEVTGLLAEEIKKIKI